MSRLEGSSVFVAGGRTGFIGANIAKSILSEADLVICHSKTPRNNKPNAISSIEECGSAHPTDFDLVDFSVKSVEWYFKYFDIGSVFHCAASTAGAKEIVNNQSSMVLPNMFMTANLLDASAKAGVKRFVFISSSVVYPDPHVEHPHAIYPNGLFEDESERGEPLPCYFGVGWMKRYCEKLAEFYHREYGMEVLIIRPSQVFGPMQSFDLNRGHAIPALIRKFVDATESGAEQVEVWGSPEVSRDYIYIDDFVEGTLKAFELFDKFDVFNICTGRNHTMQEVAGTLKKLTGFKGDVVFNADKPMTAMKRCIDPTKAKDKLGFEAKTILEEGLKRTIEWYKENR